MNAAILRELNQPLVLGELVMPQLGVGQVLVQVQYATICGAQLGEIAGKKGPDKYLPHLIGHEGVGTVLEIGPGVTTKKAGDRVILHWRPSEGIAAKGPQYRCGSEVVNAGPMACFAEQCIVSENRLTLLPDGIDEKVAPLFGCALTTAYGCVTNDANVKPGQSVLIFGAGGVGLALLEVAKLVNAYPINLIDPIQSKVIEAVRRGADYYDGLNAYDVVFDTTGDATAIERAYSMTKPQGRTILIGVPHHNDPIYIDSLPLHFGKVLTGSQGGDCQPHIDIPRMAKLVARGKLNLDGLITHEYALDCINDALDLVRSGTAGRVLLRMNA